MTRRRILNLVLIFSMLLTTVSIVSPAAVSAATPVIAPSALTFDANPDAALTPYEVNVQSPAQQIQVGNVNPGALQVQYVNPIGTDQLDFQIEGSACTLSPLAQNEVCNISVTFTPLTTGVRTAGVRIGIFNGVNTVDYDVPVQGAGRLPDVNITFSPGGLTFPDTQIGSNSPQDVVVINNNSANDINFGPGAFFITGPNANSFEINQPSAGTCLFGGGFFTLSAGNSCTVRLRFSPGGQNQGPRSAALAVTYTVGGGGSIIARSVPLSSFATTPKGTAVIATPPAITNFPDTPLNAFSTKVVIFTNTGIGSVDVTGIFANGGNSGEFTVDSTNCNVVAIVPNGTCQAIVRFTPVGPVGAIKSSALRFTYEAVNTGLEGVPADVALQGLVSPAVQPVAAFDPAGFNFGNMIIGQTSAPKLFTFTNTGTLPVTISSAPTTFGDANFPIATNPPGDCYATLVLEPGESCETYVAFAPQAAGGVGPRYGYLSLGLTDGNVLTAQLSGMAVEGGLTVSPLGENFGSLYLGASSEQREIKITNPGNYPNVVGPLTITKGGTNPTDFEIDTNNCAPNKTLMPGESCSVFVRFKPAAAGPAGDKEALLSITAGTVTGEYIVVLSGVAVEPGLLITGPNLVNGQVDFGSVPIGSLSVRQEIVVTNTTSTSLEINTNGFNLSPIFLINDDLCDGKILAPGASCSIFVRFFPLDIGPGLAFLNISTPGQTGSHVVTLLGVGTQPQITVSQSTLNFGSQQVPTTSPTKVVTITNVSGQPFQINVIGATTPEYLITADQCSNRLLTTSGAGSTCTFEVSFRPATGGTKYAEINIDGENVIGAPLPTTYVVRLEGIGFTSQVSADPIAINFADQTIGTTSQPLRATLRNNTNGSLQVTAVSLPAGLGLFSGDYSLRNNFCQNGVNPTTLAPGGTCSVDVVFTPSDQGQRPAILRFETDAAGSAHDVPITGTGAFVVAVFEASAVNFGPQVLNTTSVAQTIKVTNRGPGNLLIAQNGVTVTGPNAADFVLTFNDGCAGALAPNTSCNVQVKFTPSALGARQASLSFATNAAGNPNQVPLTGTGTTAPAYAVTINTVGNGCTTTVSPAGPYQGNDLVTLTANFNSATTVFVGWTIDGQSVGFANPLDFNVNNSSHNVLATCTPRPGFSDVNGGTPYNEAILQLAARGVIKGLGDGSFGPGQGIVRAQMAAITTRLAGWSSLSKQNSFTDRCNQAGCVDDELWNSVAVTAFFQVARGYEDNTYRPFDQVANIQAVAFITRTMVKLGYWEFQPDNVTIYPNVTQGSGHRVDISTYVYYAGAVPGTNPSSAWGGWDQPATRAYFAGIYWQAYASYFGVDHTP